MASPKRSCPVTIPTAPNLMQTRGIVISEPSFTNRSCLISGGGGVEDGDLQQSLYAVYSRYFYDARMMTTFFFTASVNLQPYADTCNSRNAS